MFTYGLLANCDIAGYSFVCKSFCALVSKVEGHIVLPLSVCPSFCPTRFHLYQTLSKHDAYLTHYQTTNFRLFQTERVCRRRFQI